MTEPDNWAFISKNGAAGRPLYPWSENATFNHRVDSHGLPNDATLDKFDRIFDQVAGDSRDLIAGRNAVLMAGPPGAGKSSSRASILERLNWREGTYLLVDPDQLKELLLQDDIDNGSYLQFVPEVVRRLTETGHHFKPMELGGLWHEESLLLADHLIERATFEGWNLIIDGTLGNRATARRRVDTLQEALYARVTVVDVEVPKAVSLARVRERYLQEKAAEHLGGRVIPSATIAQHFGAPGGMSWSLFNSNELYQSGKVGLDLVAYRNGGGPPRVTFDSLDGDRGRKYIPDRPMGYDVWVTGHTRRGRVIEDHWRRSPRRATD